MSYPYDASLDVDIALALDRLESRSALVGRMTPGSAAAVELREVMRADVRLLRDRLLVTMPAAAPQLSVEGACT